MDFFFFVPPVMHIGEGKAKLTGPLAKGMLKAKKSFVVYDKGVKSAGIVDGIVASLKSVGIEVLEYDGVVPNPTAEVVDEGGRQAIAFGADSIVAIGGGSSIDSAKGISLLVANPGKKILELEKAISMPELNPCIPLVAIPTTSGTGSEVSMGCVITDPGTHRKISIGVFSMGANIAILDPELCLGVPAHVTAATGMDVMTHAIDNVWCHAYNPLYEGLSSQAIALVAKFLPIAVKDGKNIEARSNMHLASAIAGMTMNTGLGMAHNISHAISSNFNTPHGVANAIVLPYAMEYYLPIIPEKYISIAKALSVYKDGMDGKKAGEAAITAIKALKKEINIPTLKSLNIGPDGWEKIAATSLTDTLYPRNIKLFTKEDAVAVLKRAYEDE